MSAAPPFARAIYQGTGKPGAVADPELWHLPQEGGTEEEVTDFLAALVRLVKPSLVVECGTLNGHTSEALARAQDAHRGRYIGLELDPRYAEATRMRLYRGGLAAPDTVRCEDDLHAEFRERPGLVYIDSGDNRHRLEVLARFCKERVPIIALHDAARWYGYQREAEWIARTQTYSSCYLHSPCGLWLFTLPPEAQEDTMGKANRAPKAQKNAARPAPRASCPECGGRVASRVSDQERIFDVHADGNNKCRGSGARTAA